MDPDGSGVRGDPERHADLGVREPFPRHESQDLLVVRSEPPEGLDDGRDLGRRWLVGAPGDGAQPLAKPRASGGATTLVRQETPRNTVQPRELLGLGGGNVGEATPCHDEGLGDHVFGVRQLVGSATRVCQEGREVRLEQR